MLSVRNSIVKNWKKNVHLKIWEKESDHLRRKWTTKKDKEYSERQKIPCQKKAKKHSNSLAYQCKEALGKVVRKATTVLPISSIKRPQVVKELRYLPCDNSPFGSNIDGRYGLNTY